MKTLIQLAAVALLFGGLSAAGTVFLKQRTAVATAAVADGSGAANGSEGANGSDAEGNAHDDPAKPKPKAATIPGEPQVDQTAESAGHDGGTNPVPADENLLAAAEPPRSSHHPPTVTPHSVGAEQQQHGSSATEAADSRPEARVAVRPPYTPEGDEAGTLINQLRERSRVATATERKLAERQDALQLIFEDLRTEQARTLKIRQRLAGELKESQLAIDTARQTIDSERTAMQNDLRAATEERDKLRQQLESAGPSPATGGGAGLGDAAGSPEDNVNLKKMAAVFDGMPADNTATVFEQLVKNKRITAVVSLMNAMKERPAAKVLAIITETNPELAADLTDRLKRLKTTPEKPVGE